jgi:phage repressor protein C with HTH and peptisase S24 domain
MPKNSSKSVKSANLKEEKLLSSSLSTCPVEVESNFGAQIGKRLTLIRGELSQLEFGKKVGIHQNSLSRYERTERILDAEAVSQICKACGINPTWLISGKGPMRPEDSAAGPGDTIGIPLYNVTGSAGGGSLNDSEHVEKWIYCSPQFIHQVLGVPPKSLCMIHLSGDSMEPHLPTNSMVFVDRRPTEPNQDGIYVIRLDGCIMIKQLQRLPGGVFEVSSANSSYKSFQITPTNPPGDFAVLGRVICTFKKL